MSKEQMSLWPEETRRFTMTNVDNISKLRSKLIGIRDMGYIPTHRLHDTGIGKTLEDLLGIPENNIMLPDIGETELKTKRKTSGSMLTIATATPYPSGAIGRLFDAYKYLDDYGYYNLHTTIVGSTVNPQGFRLNITGNRLVVENRLNIEAYWPLSIFDDVLKSKSDKILLVFADTKGKKNTKEEMFHYDEAFLLSDLDREKFEIAIRTDKLKVDFRIGVYRSGDKKGQYHDHGTGFRLNRRDFPMLYNKYEKIL